MVLAEDFQRSILEARLLRAKVGDLARGRTDPTCQLFLPRGISIETPGWLAASVADARIRVDAGGEAQYAGTFLIGP
jgi:hypothetical protein